MVSRTDPCEAAVFAEGFDRRLTWHTREAFCGENHERLSEGLREDRGDISMHSIAARFWSRRSGDT